MTDIYDIEIQKLRSEPGPIHPSIQPGLPRGSLHGTEGQLFRHGRQPAQLSGRPLLGLHSGVRHPRPGLLPLLAPDPHRVSALKWDGPSDIHI